MSAVPMAQTPIVPPRPTKPNDKDASSASMPKVPPRPVNQHLNRSMSPTRDRFAQSPLMQGIPPESPGNDMSRHYAQKEHSRDPIERSRSVDLPSVGEEGMEYGAVATELDHDDPRPSAPEQTRVVDEGLKLHAPKPSLPASSAKQQVMAVTRTDSDRAASFGIGHPSSGDDRTVSRNSARKRPESTYSTHSDHTDEDHGIPEIGQRVPMNKHLGDVQAPSPVPGSESSKKHHARRHSARGLPPGSYGLHGHGVAPQDKLEKAYYEKHPDVLQREHYTPHHDRQNYYAMSSSDLNKLVRDTANRHATTGLVELCSTPTDDVAFEATEKYTSRISSSRPPSIAVPNDGSVNSVSGQNSTEDDKGIHVDDSKNPEFYNYGEDKGPDEVEDYPLPILAPDEVSKDPGLRVHKPAIRPHLQRHGSSYDEEDPPSRPVSRVKVVNHHAATMEHRHTPLEDVEEYDPLFPEDGKDAKIIIQEPEEEHCERHHFPSKDIWEDAPTSAHFTAEVSTPDVLEPERRRSSAYNADRPITPAQAFAMYQEELAEKEAKGRTNNFLPLQEHKPTWGGHRPHLQVNSPLPSSSSRRFPSRDIWEDTPESHIHEAEVSASPIEHNKPEIPARPVKKASISPERPAARQESDEDSTKPRGALSDKPKPSIPPRPVKSSSGDAKDGAISKAKPSVPNKPTGGKIAALQAGFMSDLNKRLQLGPQAVKKDEPKEEVMAEGQEKPPLVDARKGRARGPQRRAPARSPAGVASSEDAHSSPVLSFSLPQTVWSVEPEYGHFACHSHDDRISPDDIKSYETSEPPAPSESEKEQPVVESKLLLPESNATSVPAANKPAVVPDELEGTSEQRGSQTHEHKPQTKEELTLAANTAGESILEIVQKNEDDGKPVEVHDDVKS